MLPQRGLRPRNRSVKSAFIALTLQDPLYPKTRVVECSSNSEPELEPEPEPELDPFSLPEANG